MLTDLAIMTSYQHKPLTPLNIKETVSMVKMAIINEFIIFCAQLVKHLEAETLTQGLGKYTTLLQTMQAKALRLIY